MQTRCILKHAHCPPASSTVICFSHPNCYIRLTALCPGLPRLAGTRKVKPIWILLKQETVSGSGISWAISKSAPCSRSIATPAPHHSVFTGWMPFPTPNQQRQSTEVISTAVKYARQQRHASFQFYRGSLNLLHNSSIFCFFVIMAMNIRCDSDSIASSIDLSPWRILELTHQGQHRTGGGV